ncbi:MAG: DUF89 family protein, partial [Verrucomicrobia bacterium]|nr:DUF89 family protein [Verrucomicrobiota bacterium]
MKTAIECIPCFARQAVEAITMAIDDGPGRARILRRLLRELADADWSETPVSISRDLHRTIRAEPGRADPYRPLKDRMNRTAVDLLPALADLAGRHSDPREAVVRLAIAGNLLDSGAKSRLEPEDLPERLGTVLEMPLVGNVAELFEAADNAHCILYLCDNAGEIVFDRLLIEALPAEKITVVVRGSPVLNDATIDDAEAAGIPEVAPVIDNGSDAPGTLIQDCSEEFRGWFDRADLVIAKGQGNYETLSDADKDIFFLLAIKCPAIAAEIGAPLGALVIKRAANVDR